MPSYQGFIQDFSTGGPASLACQILYLITMLKKMCSTVHKQCSWCQCDTCWLAHDRSVKAIRCSMRPLIDTLEHIHEDTGEPEALGMLRTMKTYNFVATLMMLSDVLPVLTCLSRALQAKTADFTLVASQLTYVCPALPTADQGTSQ